MKRLAFAVTLAAALPLFAGSALFTKYETVRQSLLEGSLKSVQTNAAALATEAGKARKAEVAKTATAVAKSADLNAARVAFATLSDEMIKVRTAAKGDRPAVYYCSMVKKSWLQPKGQVGNPYDASMKMCGELKAE